MAQNRSAPGAGAVGPQGCSSDPEDRLLLARTALGKEAAVWLAVHRRVPEVVTVPYTVACPGSELALLEAVIRVCCKPPLVALTFP